jgi:hypothetical protein
MAYAYIKVLATCGIRKLLDFVFTQRELFWLDDILPSKKAAKELHNDKNNARKSDHQSDEETYKLNDRGGNESSDNFFKATKSVS